MTKPARLADYFVVAGFDFERSRPEKGFGKIYQRFPRKEWDDVPYLFDITDFCQPTGWRITTQQQQPTFFILRLSDGVGKIFYCACLAFWEPIPSTFLHRFSSALTTQKNNSRVTQNLHHSKVWASLFDEFCTAFRANEEVEISNTNNGNNDSKTTISKSPSSPSSSSLSLFAPRCLCLIASHFHFDVLKNCLSIVYAQFVDNCSLYSIEKTVANILCSVDIPQSGGPRTTFTLDAGDKQFIVPARHQTVPVTKATVYMLIRQFGIHNVLILVSALLNDRKLLLCSRSKTRLSEAAHGLIALIYPIVFEHVCVPILPLSLMEMISAPPPFLFGIHSDSLGSIMEDMTDVYIADLDGGRIDFPRDPSLISNILEPFHQITFNLLIQTFCPELLTADKLFISQKTPVNNLLSRFSNTNNTNHQIEDIKQQQQQNSSSSVLINQIWIDKCLRAVFLRLLVQLLAGYRSCLTVTRISPQPVIQFDKALFFLLRDFQDHENFMKNFLGSLLFDSFIRTRGPPFRVCDVFDEIHGSFDTNNLTSGLDIINSEMDDYNDYNSHIMDQIRTIAERFGENENIDVNVNHELPSFINNCEQKHATESFPQLNEDTMCELMSDLLKSKIPTRSSDSSSEPRFVPYGINLRLKQNKIQLLQEKRTVIRQFLVDIFCQHLTEALKRKNTILQDLQSRHIRSIFVEELQRCVMPSSPDCVNNAAFIEDCACDGDTVVGGSAAAGAGGAGNNGGIGGGGGGSSYSNQCDRPALLSMEQFELIVSLLSEALSKNGANDESCIGAAIMQLSHNICMETHPNKLRYFAYMTAQIQEHNIWENPIFWETAFCGAVNRELRQVYLYHSESQHRYSNSTQNNSQKSSSNQQSDPVCPIYSNRMSLLEIAAEEMKVRNIRNSLLQKQLEDQEEHCVLAMIIHFINLIVQFRLPLHIGNNTVSKRGAGAGGAGGRGRHAGTLFRHNADPDADSIDKESNFEQFNDGLRDSDAESGIEPELNSSKYLVQKLEVWLTKFITKVSNQNNLSEKQVRDVISKIEFVIEGHINELEMLYPEISSMRWVRKPQIMQPILLPGELSIPICGREGFHCFLLANGQVDDGFKTQQRWSSSQSPAYVVGLGVSKTTAAGGGGGFNPLLSNVIHIGVSSLLPAQGCFFLTNYRLIFNGLPMDPYQSNKLITVSFPISSISSIRKINAGGNHHIYTATGDSHFIELMSVRSYTMQQMIIGLESIQAEDLTISSSSNQHQRQQRWNSINSLKGTSTIAGGGGGAGGTLDFTQNRTLRTTESGNTTTNLSRRTITASLLREELRRILTELRYPPWLSKTFLDILSSSESNNEDFHGNNKKKTHTLVESHSVINSLTLSAPSASVLITSGKTTSRNPVSATIHKMAITYSPTKTNKNPSGKANQEGTSSSSSSTDPYLLSQGTAINHRVMERLYLQPGYKDMVRMNLLGSKTTDQERLRVLHNNRNYSICDTYPALLVFPKDFPEDSLLKLSKSFQCGRVPTIVWKHPSSGAFMLRSGAFHLKKNHLGMFTNKTSSGTPRKFPPLIENTSSSSTTTTAAAAIFSTEIKRTSLRRQSLASLRRFQLTLQEPNKSTDSVLTREQELLLQCIVKITPNPMLDCRDDLLVDHLQQQQQQTARSSILTNIESKPDKPDDLHLNKSSKKDAHNQRQMPDGYGDTISIGHASILEDSVSIFTASHELRSATLYVLGERTVMRSLKRTHRQRLPDVDFIPLNLPTKKTLKDAYKQLCKIWLANDNNVHLPQSNYNKVGNNNADFIIATDDDDVLNDAVKTGQDILSQYKNCTWLEMIQQYIRASACIVDLMNCQFASVLLALDNDSDNACLITSLSQIMMDQEYRTINGFVSLVDREWLLFGHNFLRRSSQTAENKESFFAPYFLLFLDIVHQLLHQFPMAFEFDDFLLRFLAYHFVSNRFYNFKLSTERSRLDWMMEDCNNQRADSYSHSIWNYILQNHEEWPIFYNFAYNPDNYYKVLYPLTHLACLDLWEFYHADPLICGSSIYELDHHSPHFFDQERIQYDPVARNGYNNTHVTFTNAMLNLREGMDAYGWQELWSLAREQVNQLYTTSNNESEFANNNHSLDVSLQLYPLELSHLDSRLLAINDLSHLWLHHDRSVQNQRQQTQNLIDQGLSSARNKSHLNGPSAMQAHVLSNDATNSPGNSASGSILDSQSPSDTRGAYSTKHNQLWYTSHEFVRVSNSMAATKCQHCDRYLFNFGISRGVVKCSHCEFACHESCASQVPPQCPRVHAARKTNYESKWSIPQEGNSSAEISNSMIESQAPESDRNSLQIDTHLQNYFYKLSHHKLLQQWKERYFMLDTLTYEIRYKNSESDTVIQGIIDLNEIVKVLPIKSTVITYHKKSYDVRVLELETSSRTFRLASVDAAVSARWYECLSKLFS